MFHTINRSSSTVDKTDMPSPSSSPTPPTPALQPAWTPHILVLRTTITDIDTALIPFAILKHNPLPDFHHRYQQLLATIPMPITPATPQQAEIPVATHAIIKKAWNAPFATLNKERIFYLYAWSAIPKTSPRVIKSASFTIGIATPGPLYTRWLTTQAVTGRGEPIAWCIELDMRQAGEVGGVVYREVVLGEENKMVLAE
jgi:hypothetical protein